MALSIEQIVNGLRISRSEFGRIFVQAQMDLVENGQDRQLFEAVAHSGIDKEAFTQALTWAEQKQFLDAVVRAVVKETLEDGTITAALTAEAAAASQDPERKANLQRITDFARGLPNPEAFHRGFNIGMRWTVKVLVDRQFSGSGILIGPHLVLTAWHVVQDLFDPDPARASRFLPKNNGNTHTRLSVVFDDLSVVLAGPQSVPAHVQWCATYSECHPVELKKSLPENLNELEGFWDYAVLRLAKTPRTGAPMGCLGRAGSRPRCECPDSCFSVPGRPADAVQ